MNFEVPNPKLNAEPSRMTYHSLYKYRGRSDVRSAFILKNFKGALPMFGIVLRNNDYQVEFSEHAQHIPCFSKTVKAHFSVGMARVEVFWICGPAIQLMILLITENSKECVIWLKDHTLRTQTLPFPKRFWQLMELRT